MNSNVEPDSNSNVLANSNDADGSNHAIQNSTVEPKQGTSSLAQNSELTSQTVIKLFHDGKAGLEGLDSDHINRIINNTTRGSRFYMHKLNKQRQVDTQVESMLAKLRTTSQVELTRASHYIRKLRYEVSASARDLTHIIVHIDMDMFFAAVEMRDRPELKDLPMAVGGSSMLSTSNYIARKFGVRAAMPGFVAKKLCPQLHIVRPRMEVYREESSKVAQVIREYDPNFVPHSLDECSIDLADYLLKKCEQSNGTWSYCARRNADYDWILEPEVWRQAEEAVNEMRQKVLDRTQLSCSAGIAPNKLLAKMCSDMNKPNGQYVFAAQSSKELREFVSNVNVKKIPGIGPVQQQTLQGLGISTCSELNEQLEKLAVLFTESSMEFYVRVSVGVGSWQCGEIEAQKSESRETTFTPTDSVDTFLTLLKELSEECAASLQKVNTKGRTVTLKLKRDDFKVNVRSRTLNAPTNDSSLMFDTCKSLLMIELQPEKKLKLRLLGVRMSNFVDNAKEELKTKKEEVKQQKIDYFLSKAPSEAVKFTLEKRQIELDDSRPMDFTNNQTNVATLANPVASTSTSKLVTASLPDGFVSRASSTYYQPIVECDPMSIIASHSSKDTNLDVSIPDLPTSYVCPVCGLRRCADLDQLNQHIDYCLSRDAILSSVDETNRIDYTSSSTMSSASSSASGSTTMKRKNSGSNKKQSPVKMKKLTDYFK
jgi:DNA polymerase kappa